MPSCSAQADRLSHALQRLGVRRGDRVAIVMPQRPETAVAHVAIYQLGAVAMPLSMLFGPDALAYRLQDSAAPCGDRRRVVDRNLRAARGECPQLETLLAVGAAQGPGGRRLAGSLNWPSACKGGNALRAAVATSCRRPRRADLHQRHHRAPRKAR
jgi:acetyl-CoA synthetase